MSANYLDVAIEAALEAGKILREEYALPPDIHYKGDVDLVTQADRRSERAIVARLSKFFPEHTIAAEEGTGHERSPEFRWHVDPLDGTTNFAHKYPCFAVSIALAQNGVVLAGVVYNPIYDELFAAAVIDRRVDEVDAFVEHGVEQPASIVITDRGSVRRASQFHRAEPEGSDLEAGAAQRSR